MMETQVIDNLQFMLQVSFSRHSLIFISSITILCSMFLCVVTGTRYTDQNIFYVHTVRYYVFNAYDRSLQVAILLQSWK